MPVEVFIESDSRMTVSAETLETGGTSFDLSLSEVASYHMTARLGEGEAILDVAEISGVEVASNNLDLTRLHTWEDGTRLVRMTVKLPEVVEGIEIRLSTFTGGIFFG